MQLLVLPLSGFDIVLGLQCLRSLGGMVCQHEDIGYLQVLTTFHTHHCYYEFLWTHLKLEDLVGISWPYIYGGIVAPLTQLFNMHEASRKFSSKSCYRILFIGYSSGNCSLVLFFMFFF
ncbi:hypothetical protein ACJX0J_012374 [Zea mays]